MYILFYNDELKAFVGAYETRSKALLVARAASRDRGRPVIGIYNMPSGDTVVCFKFECGEQTYDGCCASAWTAAAPEVERVPAPTSA
jgi:hypothetical protein